MVSDAEEIRKIAIPDSRIKTVIDKFGYIYVIGKSFKFQQGRPHAFAFGYNLMGVSFGDIYVSDWAVSQFNEKELEWIILHELAHIVNNHIPLATFLDLASVGVSIWLSDVFEIDLFLAESIVKFFRSLRTIATGGITAIQELIADKWATNFQGTKNYGISTLWKLSGGNIDMVSHIAKGFIFEVPALTVKQRIDALMRDP